MPKMEPTFQRSIQRDDHYELKGFLGVNANQVPIMGRWPISLTE